MANAYKEFLKLQPSLRVRDLESIVKEKHNYNFALSIYIRVRKKVLDSIIGYYKK